MLIGVSAPCAGAPEWAAGTGWRWADGTESCHLHPLAWNQEPHRRPPYMLVPVPVPSRRWCGKCRQIGPFLDELVSKHPGVVRDGAWISVWISVWTCPLPVLQVTAMPALQLMLLDAP